MPAARSTATAARNPHTLALSAEKLEERYRHQQQTASKLAARFSEEGLRMLLLKGLGLSRDYPIPEHRECGDIDIYLYGQSDKGDRILHEIGHTSKFDVPKHSEYVWDGVLIENHRTILNVRRNRTEPGAERPVGAVTGEGRHARPGAGHTDAPGDVQRHIPDTPRRRAFPEGRDRTAAPLRLGMFPDTALGRDRPCTVPHGDGGLPHGQVRRPDDGRRRGIPRGGGSGPGMRSGMLGRFMEEVFTLSPMPDKPLPRLFRKLSGPYRNRWRLREVLRTPVWRYYYDTVRGQWNEKFTVFR